MKTKSITDINNQVIRIFGEFAERIDRDKVFQMSGAEQKAYMAQRIKFRDKVNEIKQTYFSNIISSEEYKTQSLKIERESGVKDLPLDCSQRIYLERCNRNECHRIQIPINIYRNAEQ